MVKLLQKQVRLLHLVIKMPENSRNKLFRSRQATDMVALLFLDVKMLEERFGRRSWTMETNKQGTAHVFSV